MAEGPNIKSLTVQRYLGYKDAKSTEVYIREASRDFNFYLFYSLLDSVSIFKYIFFVNK